MQIPVELTSELIKALVNTSDIENDAPAVFNRQSGKKHLIYFGAEHSFDPLNPQFEAIHKLYSFLRPNSVLIEGAHPFSILLSPEAYEKEKKGIVNASDEKLIRVGGEVLFTAKLALRSNAFLFSPELSLSHSVAYIQDSLNASRESIFAYRIMVEFYTWISRESASDLEAFLRDGIAWFQTETSWKDFNYSLEAFQRICKDLLSIEDFRDLNKEAVKDFISPIARHPLQDVAIAFGKVRDIYLLEHIIDHIEKFDRVFVCYGYSHLGRKRKALDKLFDFYDTEQSLDF